MATNKMNRTVVPLNFISQIGNVDFSLPAFEVLFSTLHPDRNPRREDGNRQQQDRNVRHQPALSFGHRQTAVLRILGPDRDKVFILSEPAHGVQEKISISLRTEEAV